MAKIRINLETVQATDGQGIGEGNFELNIRASDGKNTVHWPAPYPEYSVVDQGGGIKTIEDGTVGTYELESGTLSKSVSLYVREFDKGTLGGADEGSGNVTFELTPSMAATRKSATIPLKPRNMKANGAVKVTLLAQRV
jgi:hypothetical protein